MRWRVELAGTSRENFAIPESRTIEAGSPSEAAETFIKMYVPDSDLIASRPLDHGGYWWVKVIGPTEEERVTSHPGYDRYYVHVSPIGESVAGQRQRFDHLTKPTVQPDSATTSYILELLPEFSGEIRSYSRSLSRLYSSSEASVRSADVLGPEAQELGLSRLPKADEGRVHRCLMAGTFVYLISLRDRNERQANSALDACTAAVELAGFPTPAVDRMWAQYLAWWKRALAAQPPLSERTGCLSVLLVVFGAAALVVVASHL